jgi:cyclophilin family peptidyl-prolyl cis-trans isomerase
VSKQRRRRRYVPQSSATDFQSVNVPGPIRLMTNPKVFAAVSLVFAGAILGSLLLSGLIRGSTSGSGAPDLGSMQANAVPDKPADTPTADLNGTPVAAVATPATKRYDTPPPMTIDANKTYQATVKTTRGDIQIQIDAKAAPEAVNSFLFLAHEGYYNNTPFLQIAPNADGSRFTAQAGDPTGTGLGSPGYFVNKESTTAPFARGAVGMGGSANNSNGGQFFISYGDYPALTNKYTIFGKIVSGMDVVDKLYLLDLTKKDTTGTPDRIISVDVQESIG